MIQFINSTMMIKLNLVTGVVDQFISQHTTKYIKKKEFGVTL